MTTPAAIDITRPNAARVYDYWLGGKNNVDAARTSGDLAAAFPTIRTAAVETADSCTAPCASWSRRQASSGSRSALPRSGP